MKSPWYMKCSKPYWKDGEAMVDITVNHWYVLWVAIKMYIFDITLPIVFSPFRMYP